MARTSRWQGRVEAMWRWFVLLLSLEASPLDESVESRGTVTSSGMRWPSSSTKSATRSASHPTFHPTLRLPREGTNATPLFPAMPVALSLHCAKPDAACVKSEAVAAKCKSSARPGTVLAAWSNRNALLPPALGRTAGHQAPAHEVLRAQVSLDELGSRGGRLGGRFPLTGRFV
ncbi:hypothetical protein QBC39DRAFT_84202 [Podospora conica]|nr:hypothetical protein QBC39DRAFT_84202 [Schizothecium conicum]